MHFINLAAIATLATFVAAIDKTTNPSLVASLKTAATQLDRLDLIPSNSDWLFDFKAQKSYTYSPGSVINANAATFPATVGNGLTLAWLALGPCAMLPPHFHPRAANYVVAIEGNTTTYMVEENGAHVISETLTPGKMTIFPQGSLHSMQNNLCTNSTLISALNSEDQGTHNILNGLFELPSDIVYAAFGNNKALNLGGISKLIPAVGTGSVTGSQECMKRCGIVY